MNYKINNLLNCGRVKCTMPFCVAVLVAAPLWSHDIHAEENEQDEVAPSSLSEIEPLSLAQRVPAVSRRSFSKSTRLALGPSVGLSLNDPYFENTTLGGTLDFYIGETFALGLAGEWYLAQSKDLDIEGGLEPPDSPFVKTNYTARLQATWSPLYGKINLLAEKVLHMDMYVRVGAGILSPDAGKRLTTISVALGQHYFINSWMALVIELRSDFYRMARNLEPPVTVLQHGLSANLGWVFFFPEPDQQEDF